MTEDYIKAHYNIDRLTKQYMLIHLSVQSRYIAIINLKALCYHEPRQMMFQQIINHAENFWFMQNLIRCHIVDLMLPLSK